MGLKILISGASGFIGASLCQHLRALGHTTIALTHSKSSDPNYIFWNPKKKQASIELFTGFDAVVHLAGEPLTFKRWSRKKKEKIFQSRVDSSKFLAEILQKLEIPPKIFISASAVGYYGNRGDEVLTECSSKGTGFLSDVCEAWENATNSLKEKNIAIMHARFAMVLGNGGALAKMLPFYKLGLGACLGSGQQWVSWISLEDLVRALAFLLDNPFTGKINICSPNPLIQKEFSKKMAEALHRPHFLKIPSVVLTTLLGTMAEEMLLSSNRVSSKKIQDLGFTFKYPDLGEFFKTVFFDL